MTDHIALLTLQDTRREQDNNPGVHQERWAFNESNFYREKLGMLNSEYSRYGPDLSWNGLMTFERSFKQKSCWQNCAESHQRRWSMHVFVSENGGVPQNCDFSREHDDQVIRYLSHQLMCLPWPAWDTQFAHVRCIARDLEQVKVAWLGEASTTPMHVVLAPRQ